MENLYRLLFPSIRKDVFYYPDAGKGVDVGAYPLPDIGVGEQETSADARVTAGDASQETIPEEDAGCSCSLWQQIRSRFWDQ